MFYVIYVALKRNKLKCRNIKILKYWESYSLEFKSETTEMKFNLLFVDIFEFYDKKICLSFSSGIHPLSRIYIPYLCFTNSYVRNLLYFLFISVSLKYFREWVVNTSCKCRTNGLIKIDKCISRIKPNRRQNRILSW